MHIHKIIDFLDKMMTFYHHENQALMQGRLGEILKNIAIKEDFQQQFEHFLQDIDQNLSIFKNLDPLIKTTIKQKLEAISSLSDQNQRLISEFSDRQNHLFDVVCRLIQESQKPSAVYSSGGAFQRCKNFAPVSGAQLLNCRF